MATILSSDIDSIINSFRTYDELEKYYEGTNYKWKRFVASYKANIDDTDDTLQPLSNLTTLECGDNKNFTDNGLKSLSNLTRLYCRYNNNFTDKGLKSLSNLTTFYCLFTH